MSLEDVFSVMSLCSCALLIVGTGLIIGNLIKDFIGEDPSD